MPLAPTREAWWKNPPRKLEGQMIVLDARIDHLNDQTEEGIALREIYHTLQERSDVAVEQAKTKNPFAFVRLSWEQCLKLNSWVWGITFLIDFDANRKGKTAGAIFNALLWMLPNDPQWVLWKDYTDPWQRFIHLIPRPDIHALQKIQTFLEENPDIQGDPKHQPYDPQNVDKFAILQQQLPDCFKPCFPKPPINDRKCEMWQGAPDSDYHKNIIMPEWRKWLPQSIITRDSEYDKRIDLTIEQGPRKIDWKIIFKSYEAKDEKFSGAAVNAICLTEGIKQAHLNEIKQRFKEFAFASWDYTPYEPRNTGQKTAIAHRVFKGKEQLPLRPFIFSGFGIQKTPDFILPDSKRKDLIRAWAGKEEGKARIDGNFFSSSPIVLTNLDGSFHCVPWTRMELFDKFPTGRLYRGLDPGYDHPTACAWGLLTPTNTWYIYRVLSESGLSLGARCKRIIEISGNSRQKIKFGQGEDDYYYEEIHNTKDSEQIMMTIADYHTFKADERTRQPYAVNYTREGLLLVPSVTIGPRERAQQFDRKLEPDLIRPHPISKIPPGAKVYFLINEHGVAQAFEKLENIFWDRYVSGESKGLPKDEIQDFEDDEFDAISYLLCSPYRWSNVQAPRRESKEITPFTNQNSKFFQAIAQLVHQ